MNYLITAIGSLSADAVISSLRSMPDAHIIGCNMYPADWTATSPLVDDFHQIPPARDTENFIRALLDICRDKQVHYLIPLTDTEVDALSATRGAFSSLGTVLCLSGHHAIYTCRDKLLIHTLFEEDNLITIIPTWDMDNLSKLAMEFPLIAKPRSGRSSEGVIHILDENDLSHHKRKLQGAGYILQPLLEGTVCVTDIVRQQATGRCSAMSRKELLRTSNGAGLTVEMIPDDELNQRAQHIAECLDINGCINIEFLMHKDQPHLMDINPRFSAGVAFSRLAGYDMVGNHIRCFIDEPIENVVIPSMSIYTRHNVEMLMAPISFPA